MVGSMVSNYGNLSRVAYTIVCDILFLAPTAWFLILKIKQKDSSDDIAVE